MLKIAKLAVAFSIATLSIPAFAQSPLAPRSADGFAYADAEESGFQPEQYRYFANEENETHAAWTQSAPAARVAKAASGFTYRGDGTGWEVTPHKLIFVNGKLVHSNECDHAIRIVQGPSAGDIDAARMVSPGA